jgi:hypothetical protein
MSREGWLKLHRQIRDHWIWNDPVKLRWWLDILMEVNHSERTFQIGYKLFTCKTGECVMSLQNWGKRWKVSKTVVNNFFRMLEFDNMIKTVNETVTTRIIVCNYAYYQGNVNANETDIKRVENGIEPEQSTTKELKEKKEFKRNNADEVLNEKFLLSLPNEWKLIVRKWLNFKKEKNQSYKGNTSLATMFEKLKQFSNNNPIVGAEIIENSISNNYSGFFEPKEKISQQIDTGKILFPKTENKKQTLLKRLK